MYFIWTKWAGCYIIKNSNRVSRTQCKGSGLGCDWKLGCALAWIAGQDVGSLSLSEVFGGITLFLLVITNRVKYETGNNRGWQPSLTVYMLCVLKLRVNENHLTPPFYTSAEGAWQKERGEEEREGFWKRRETQQHKGKTDALTPDHLEVSLLFLFENDAQGKRSSHPQWNRQSDSEGSTLEFGKWPLIQWFPNNLCTAPHSLLLCFICYRKHFVALIDCGTGQLLPEILLNTLTLSEGKDPFTNVSQ